MKTNERTKLKIRRNQNIRNSYIHSVKRVNYKAGIVIAKEAFLFTSKMTHMSTQWIFVFHFMQYYIALHMAKSKRNKSSAIRIRLNGIFVLCKIWLNDNPIARYIRALNQVICNICLFSIMQFHNLSFTLGDATKWSTEKKRKEKKKIFTIEERMAARSHFHQKCMM